MKKEKKKDAYQYENLNKQPRQNLEPLTRKDCIKDLRLGQVNVLRW